MFLFSCIFAAPFMVKAEFYKYKDNTGRIYFVDDVSKIPEVYLDQIKVYKEKYDDLTEQERQRMMANENRKQVTNVTISQNKVLVPVRMGFQGKEIEMLLLLDTGASIVTLHDDVAKKLNFDKLQQAKGRVAGGKEVTFDVATVDYLSVGPYEKNDILVGILTLEGRELGYDGLLGMNFLQFFSYDIDFENQIIKWALKTN